MRTSIGSSHTTERRLAAAHADRIAAPDTPAWQQAFAARLAHEIERATANRARRAQGLVRPRPCAPVDTTPPTQRKPDFMHPHFLNR